MQDLPSRSGWSTRRAPVRPLLAVISGRRRLQGMTAGHVDPVSMHGAFPPASPVCGTGVAPPFFNPPRSVKSRLPRARASSVPLSMSQPNDSAARPPGKASSLVVPERCLWRWLHRGHEGGSRTRWSRTDSRSSATSITGASGALSNTGDGLRRTFIQIRRSFFAEGSAAWRFTLPEAGEYGVQDFSANPTVRRKVEEKFEQVVEARQGRTFLGWRTVPVKNASLGDTAKSAEPFMRQCFIARPDGLDELGFERKLYVIRKRAYTVIRTSTLAGAERSARR